MAEKKPQSLEELYAQQQAVSQAEYSAKKALAEQSAAQQRQSIADELAKQRQAYTSSRQQVQEQSYLNDKSLSNQLLNRGLGASGVADVRRLQSKIASDKALTELSQSNADVVKQGMNAQTQTEQSLQNALRQASLEYEKSNLGAGETLYGRQQGERNLQLQLAQMLAEASASGASPEAISQIQKMASAAVASGGDLSSLITSGQLGTPTNVSQGDNQFNSVGEYSGKDVGRSFIPVIGNILNAVENKNLFDIFGLAGAGLSRAGKSKYTYNIPNVGNTSFDTPQQATQYINDLYSNRENAGSIKVIMTPSNSIRFVTSDDKQFKTFNAASNYLTNQNKG